MTKEPRGLDGTSSMVSVEPLEFMNLQVELNSFKYKKEIFLRDSELREIIEKSLKRFL